MTKKRKHLLDGITVLDLTQHVAGPSCTRMMAEMGAEIIKVELAPYGEQIRDMGYKKGGRGIYFLQQNRGKKSLCIDAKTEEGKKILHGLIKKVDVLIENFAPGVIGRLGCSWEVVHELNPECIMCSISTFGQTGPLSELPGFDYIGQSYAGITGLIGDPDKAPSIPAAALGDTMTGAHALAAINAALFHRAMGGEAEFIDVTLLDSYFHCHEMYVGYYSASDGKLAPKRPGSHHRLGCPMGIFNGKEGYITIIATPPQWERMCDVMEMPELKTDPRFADPNDRIRRRRELIPIIEEWLQSHDSDAAAIAKLEAARIPVAPVLSVPEAMEHPHLVERGTVRTVTQRGAGTFKMPGMPLRFSGYPSENDLEAPYKGEHNTEVLTKYLDYSEEKIAELMASGILVDEDIPEPGTEPGTA